MTTIGTVLPTKKSLAATDRWYADQLRKKAVVEQEGLACYTKRVIGREVRFYKTDTVYATVSHTDLKIRWFETRSDGDYSIKSPC